MNPKILSSPVKLRRVYVWELPVRFYHWINALALTVLIVTGFIIANPPVLLSDREPSAWYWFGTVRYIHFLAAYVAFFNFLFRIYWGFVGNKYARWDKFIPKDKRSWKDIWYTIKVDVFLQKGSEKHPVGHNRLAGIIYFGLFALFVIQCFTGFGLYSAMSDWWFPNLFSWVPGLFGGDFLLRQVHHWANWLFVLFIVIHVYLTFYHDYIEGRGIISSMGGGWKFIEEEDFEEDQNEK